MAIPQYSVISELVEGDDGVYRPTYKWQRTRFLLKGGKVIDVELIRDDSDIREWIVDRLKLGDHRNEIVGSTTLPAVEAEVEPEKPKKPVKRVAKKPARHTATDETQAVPA